MKIVSEITVYARSKGLNGNNRGGKSRSKRGSRREEQKRMVNELIKENNDIYKRAKQRGHSLPEERARCNEIKEELMRMKAI